MKRKNAMLVYQYGLANVFEVDSFNLSDYGRGAKRAYQGDFRGAVEFARGLGYAGWNVHTAACGRAGDIINSKWDTKLDEAPFCNHPTFTILNINNNGNTE